MSIKKEADSRGKPFNSIFKITEMKAKVDSEVKNSQQSKEDKEVKKNQTIGKTNGKNTGKENKIQFNIDGDEFVEEVESYEEEIEESNFEEEIEDSKDHYIEEDGDKNEDIVDGDQEEEQTYKCDVFLKMNIHIVRKEEEANKCICHLGLKENPDFTEEEVIAGLKVCLNKHGDLELFDVIISIVKLGYPLTGGFIQIFSYRLRQYINFGCVTKQKIILNDSEYIHNNVIKIQSDCFIDERFIESQGSSDVALPIRTHVDSRNESENEEESDENATHNQTQITASNKVIKKHKERKIGYIIEKVNLWRKLYNGYFNAENEFIKYSLVDAARKINVPKKTLDDYLRQLRLGRKLGYDFNKNWNTNVGNLRDYVKEKNVVIKKDKLKEKADSDIVPKEKKKRQRRKNVDKN